MEFLQASVKLLLLFFILGAKYIECSEFYSLTAKDLKGDAVPMSFFKGKILLIVNVASECGYTDRHYKELVQLQTDLSDDDFTVLAFPCNQFGNQEPLRNSGIARVVKEKYKVNFPVFSKVKVIGAEAHPVYEYLTHKTGVSPEWNFGKYLVNRAGKVIHFWNQNVSPLTLRKFIKKHINMAITDDFEVYDVHSDL